MTHEEIKRFIDHMIERTIVGLNEPGLAKYREKVELLRKHKIIHSEDESLITESFLEQLKRQTLAELKVDKETADKTVVSRLAELVVNETFSLEEVTGAIEPRWRMSVIDTVEAMKKSKVKATPKPATRATHSDPCGGGTIYVDPCSGPSKPTKPAKPMVTPKPAISSDPCGGPPAPRYSPC